MKSKFIVLMVVLVAASISQGAFTVSGVSGVWLNETSSPEAFPTLSDGDSKLTWGDPIFPFSYETSSFRGTRSSLDFDAVDAGSVVLNDVFRLGSLTHENRWIMQSTTVTANLYLELTIQQGLISETITEQLDLISVEETDNFSGLVGGSPDDIVTLPTTFLSHTLANGYTFELVGFTAGSGFNTIERNDHITYLEGKITGPSIPAPGAILLGSIGIALVGWTRRWR